MDELESKKAGKTLGAEHWVAANPKIVIAVLVLLAILVVWQYMRGRKQKLHTKKGAKDGPTGTPAEPDSTEALLAEINM